MGSSYLKSDRQNLIDAKKKQEKSNELGIVRNTGEKSYEQICKRDSLHASHGRGKLGHLRVHLLVVGLEADHVPAEFNLCIPDLGQSVGLVHQLQMRVGQAIELRDALQEDNLLSWRKFLNVLRRKLGGLLDRAGVVPLLAEAVAGLGEGIIKLVLDGRLRKKSFGGG